jgi:hypothetical protein
MGSLEHDGFESEVNFASGDHAGPLHEKGGKQYRGKSLSDRGAGRNRTGE